MKMDFNKNNIKQIKLPEGFDWQTWINRWDLMQQRYLVKRTESFKVMTYLLQESQETVVQIVDLGCGTGSLILEMLEAFP
ncbi:MAG: hypothetical protein ACYSUJ_13345, partial [Planctomycetota bacterium]